MLLSSCLNLNFLSVNCPIITKSYLSIGESIINSLKVVEACSFMFTMHKALPEYLEAYGSFLYSIFKGTCTLFHQNTEGNVFGWVFTMQYIFTSPACLLVWCFFFITSLSLFLLIEIKGLLSMSSFAFIVTLSSAFSFVWG